MICQTPNIGDTTKKERKRDKGRNKLQVNSDLVTMRMKIRNYSPPESSGLV